MTKVEYAGNGGCPQRDSTECEGYAGARSAVRPENGEMAVRTPNLLEKILSRDNLNNAYRRVKANKGAPGVDGMTVEEALPWLKEHGRELTDSILQGKFKPDPVRRKEIPKEYAHAIPTARNITKKSSTPFASGRIFLLSRYRN